MSHYHISSKPIYTTLPINVILHSSKKPGFEITPINSHLHEQLEINLMISGEMIVTVENRSYQLGPNDAVLCNPFAVHSGKWLSSSGEKSFIGFSIDLDKMLNFELSPLAKSCKELFEYKCEFDEFYPANTSRIPHILQELLAVHLEKNNANECRALSLTYELLEELFAKHFHPVNNHSSSCKNINFLRDLAMFINNNYTKDITTSTVAKAMFMETSQFCHTFKRNFGVCFSNHLCKFRCIRATELYKYSDKSISEIASAVGFSDYCYFSKSFKKHIGISPAKYFGKWKN